jgi:formylglycine-generating enzyme required for sulfatase activity
MNTAKLLASPILYLLSVGFACEVMGAQSPATPIASSATRIPGRKFRECAQCPEMMVIPPGRYHRTAKIVSDADDRAEVAKHTDSAREVTIPSALAVGVYPVTRAEYVAFVHDTNRQSAGGCKVWKGGIQWTEDLKVSWRDPGFRQTDAHPVVCVSWEDAQAYVRWLNSQVQGVPRVRHLGTGPYRLLSWEEAEYATGAGASAPFYWGETPDRNMANFGAEDCDPCSGLARGRDRWVNTSPVGSFPPNAFGLFDMAGNVWQLTDGFSTLWDPPNTALVTSRIMHGGSWLDNADRMRTGAWSYAMNVERVVDVGFRVARTLSENDSATAQDSDQYSFSSSSDGRDKGRHSHDVTAGMQFRDCPKCPQMVVVPPGTFYMQPQQWFEKSWEPVQVTIAKPFAIGEYDVTREEYAQFVNKTGRAGGEGCQVTERGVFWAKKKNVTWDHPGFAQTKRDPVVCVSWEDAQAYVRWLNGKTNGSYRLPSGQEWEYAAQGGTITVAQTYYWGNAASHDRANFGLDLCGHCGAKKEGRDRWLYTSPVGSFPSNAFGLFDPFGNVWQFTDDCYHNDAKGIPTDGSAWTIGGDCNYRAARGASFDDEKPGGGMNTFPATTRNNANGFRVVRNLD